MKKIAQAKESKQKYYNSYEFHNIRDLGTEEGLIAKELYEDYLQKYPRDYLSYQYYASFLIRFGKFKDAKKILEYSYNLASKDSTFINTKKKYKLFNRNYIIYKLRLLFYEEKYQEFLNLYNEKYEIIKDKFYPNDAIIVYCNKKLGNINLKREEGRTYLYRQILEYQEEDFLEHIKKHLADEAINIEEASSAIFVPEFPIEKVLDEIKKCIPSEKCIYPGGLENTYLFKYNECGRVNYHLTDYFRVYCFHNTKNLITISPTILTERNFQYTDLNYLKEEKKEIIKKRLTQIEKFNNKYKKLVQK